MTEPGLVDAVDATYTKFVATWHQEKEQS